MEEFAPNFAATFPAFIDKNPATDRKMPKSKSPLSALHSMWHLRHLPKKATRCKQRNVNSQLRREHLLRHHDRRLLALANSPNLSEQSHTCTDICPGR